MPTYEVNAPDGKKYRVNAPSGASEQDAISYVQREFYSEAKQVTMPVPDKQFGERVNEVLGDASVQNVGRQLGLTARHGIEGVTGMAGMFAEPFRFGMNLIPGVNIPPADETGTAVADVLGLPKPQNRNERIAADASKMMAGGGALLKSAQLATKVPGIVGSVAETLAANPAQQAQATLGGGTSYGYVKETGGNPVAQALAAMAGSVALPVGVHAVKSAPQAMKSAVEYVAPGLTKPADLSKVDIVIDNLMTNSGMKASDLTASVRSQLRADVSAALKAGGQLDDAALKRLADYRLVGATPTRATLTLDPGEVSRQKNAAKFGINSADPKLQQLGQIENANNKALIEGLNNLGANTTDDTISGANKVIGTLRGMDTAAKRSIDTAYESARATAGRSAALDPSAFTQRANNLLDDALVGGKLDGDVRNVMNRISKGEMPFTVDVAEQLKTRIGDLQRASSDGSVRKALGLVRQALEDTPLLEGQGKAAIDAFGKARAVNRQWMSIVDRVPALQAVRDGIEPDKFVQQFIIGGGKDASVMDVAKLKTLVKDQPQAMQAIRGQILSHLKDKALSGSSDEVGNLSQSALNRALSSIGDRKLRLFFNKAEIEQIKAISRVASYEQVQPRGSAVNNSNTAGAALATLFDKLASSPLLGKIPLAPQMAGNVSASLMARRALNAPQALILPQQGNKLNPYLLPAIAGSGLLSE